jgi:hypothetical protein
MGIRPISRCRLEIEAEAIMRARELGLACGSLPPGRRNAIDRLFQAVAEATEEAVLAALAGAATTHPTDNPGA